MATTINAITGVWQDWVPTSLPGATDETVLGERIFSWGTPVVTQQDSLVFHGAAAQSVGIGESFPIGTITLRNRQTTGGPLTALTLQLTFRFNTVDGPVEQVSLSFTFSDSGVISTPDTLALSGSLPLTLEGGELRLRIDSFTGPSAAEDADSQVTLSAVLLRTPFESELCTTYIPVFQPAACTVDPVCPIEDGPIIEDCSIPDPPGPMTDCPEIDVPVGFGSDSGGTQGPPGADGAPGCTIQLETSYAVVLVYDCNATGLVVTLGDCLGDYGPPFPPTCCFKLQFTFYICYYDVFFVYSCCPFLWCGDVWVPGNDYFCTGIDPPEITGLYEGQLILKCSCTTTTTTTTTTPAPLDWPDTLEVHVEWNILSNDPANDPGTAYTGTPVATRISGSIYEVEFVDNYGNPVALQFRGEAAPGTSNVYILIASPTMGNIYLTGETNGWDGTVVFTSNTANLILWPGTSDVGDWHYIIS